MTKTTKKEPTIHIHFIGTDNEALRKAIRFVAAETKKGTRVPREVK